MLSLLKHEDRFDRLARRLRLAEAVTPDLVSEFIRDVCVCSPRNAEADRIQRLVEAGADFNKEVKRETALSAALASGQIAVIEYLEALSAYSPPSTTPLGKARVSASVPQ